MNPLTLLRRAFASPSATKLNGAEAAHYLASGVSEPALQRYLAWRRALIFMVVIATLLSAGLTTYRDLTESDDEPKQFDAVFENIMGKVNAMVPAITPEKAEALKAKLDDLKPAADELKKKVDELKPQAEKLQQKLKDLPSPAPTPAPAPVFHLPSTPAPAVAPAPPTPTVEKDDEEEKKAPAGSEKSKVGKDDAEETEVVDRPPNTFERFTDLMESAPLYVLALTALLALFTGKNDLRLSFKLLAAGFLFGFLVPMLVAVCPWSWFGHPEPNVSLAKDPVEYLRDFAEGLMEGGHYLVILLPTVLSLVPGVLKGCLKVKNALPQSLLPGWFVVMAAPLYGLFLLVIFIAIDQVTSEPLLLAGFGLIVLAHFVYPLRAEAFTAPLLTKADHQRLKGAQLLVTAITAVGGILLLIFLLRQNFMGIELLGTDPKKSLMQPLDLVEKGLEFVARSMFVTALSVDLFMRMNLRAWRHIRLLAMAPDAMEYQQAMDGLEKLAG